MDSKSRMRIEGFFDPETSTVSYIVQDPASGRCAVVDSVLDYNPKAGRTSHRTVERLAFRLHELDATVDWILETHVHADHLSAAPWLKARFGGRIGIGRHITTVQRTFGELFNAGPEFARDGRQFDHLFDDGETFQVGSLVFRAMHTPGHTLACLSYVVDDGSGRQAVLVGDTLFMPDYGTARCDFPGGDARTLYRSIRRLLDLPPDTVMYLCHDYRPGGRELRHVSTVAEQREKNVHIHDGIGEDTFVEMRTARDRTLGAPVLMLPSVQVNMRAGNLPEPDDNGIRYLRIPLDAI